MLAAAGDKTSLTGNAQDDICVWNSRSTAVVRVHDILHAILLSDILFTSNSQSSCTSCNSIHEDHVLSVHDLSSFMWKQQISTDVNITVKDVVIILHQKTPTHLHASVCRQAQDVWSSVRQTVDRGLASWFKHPLTKHLPPVLPRCLSVHLFCIMSLDHMVSFGQEAPDDSGLCRRPVLIVSRHTHAAPQPATWLSPRARR